MDDVQWKLELNAPPRDVYEAIASADGPKHWWTAHAEVDAREGGRAHFPFDDAGFHATFEIAKLEPARLVEWQCVDSKHSESSGWSDLTEWAGTTVRFEIEPTETGCRLTFTHVGLTPRLECHDVCRSSWRKYLDESLRGYVEKGEGTPFRNKSAGG